jgi:CheY-like chemotaxis protein
MLQCALDRTTTGVAPMRRRTVLVVDDDELVRESLSLALELEGYATVLAAHGIDALIALRTGTRPDLILLDLEMPVMPGWEFRERQLADPAFRDIPVVVVSSSHRQVSANRRLTKPFDLDHLLRTVREVGGPARAA